MSGIAGIICFDGAPVEVGLVEKMTAAMPYRGPDGIHHWVKGSVAMGQCMLHTTPESLEEKQPLTNEDESLLLVMDGRVDNWEELRKELLRCGVVLRNRSDAELVLRSYETWGEDCLTHIDGDFALVIWNAQLQVAFCARDRLGNKPFYYHWDKNVLVFSSELRTILALPWVRQDLNQGMLAEFLTCEWYSNDETFWNGIMRLMAAHRMEVRLNGLMMQQYWSPDFMNTLPYTKDEDFVEHYRELFTDTVRRMSRSHKTLACEVSGGLDSSAVFCMAEHLRKSGKLAAPGLEGYTLAFSDGNAVNDLEYARAVGKYLNHRIHEVPPSSFPITWFKQKASKDRNFPGYPNAAMSIGIQEKVSLHGSVLLSGLGGDEWLQGSRAYYAEELALGHWDRFYDCFKADVDVFGLGQAIKWVARFGLFPLLPEQIQNVIRYSMKKMRGNYRQDRYWLSPQICELIEERRKLLCAQEWYKVAALGQRQLVDTLYSAFDNHAMDMFEHLSANSGVEMRHPFRSHKLIQYAFSVPERLRLRGDTGKYVHVQALRKLMPQVILERKSKAEFSSTFSQYLDQMEEFFIKELPNRRKDWVTSDGMRQVFRATNNNQRAGWQYWVLWGIFGCDSISR